METTTMSRWRPRRKRRVRERQSGYQGVFVVRDKRAVFVPVQTGITGVTDIEVTSGLQEGDQISSAATKRSAPCARRQNQSG